MANKLEGRTGDVASTFLDSDFWEPGVSITGTVQRKFESVNGQRYALEVDEPVEINGEPTREVALGNLAGLRVAIQPAGAADLEVGDKINLGCTEPQPTGKGQIPASISKFRLSGLKRSLNQNLAQTPLKRFQQCLLLRLRKLFAAGC